MKKTYRWSHSTTPSFKGDPATESRRGLSFRNDKIPGGESARKSMTLAQYLRSGNGRWKNPRRLGARSSL